jgi:hypothetical protein
MKNQPLQIQQPLLQLLQPSVLAIQVAAAPLLVAVVLYAVGLVEYKWVLYVLAHLMIYNMIQSGDMW